MFAVGPNVGRVNRLGVLLTPALLAGTHFQLRAQQPQDQLWVEVRPYAPRIGAAVVRGDSVLFGAPDDRDATAWMFDRRRRSFTRVHAVVPTPYAPISDDDLIADSLRLHFVSLANGNRSRVLLAGKQTITLRGPRVLAERRWRAAHRLTPIPPLPDTADADPTASRETDWQPIDVKAIAVDSTSIWLGLQRNDEYADFALGGLVRVDRRSRRLEIETDSVLLRADIRSIVPWRAGYILLIAPSTDNDSSSIVFFDPATRRAKEIPLPRDIFPSAVSLSGHTAWIAAGDNIAVLDLGTARIVRRGFRLSLNGDSVVYELADRTRPPPLQLLAAVGLADQLQTSRVAELVRAVMTAVRVDAYQYNELGERWPTTVTRDSTDSDSVVVNALATALSVRGIDAPSVRPFIYDALSRPWNVQFERLAELVISTHDTASISALHAGLDSANASAPERDIILSGAASEALALATLGDSTGVYWLRFTLGIPIPATARHGPARFPNNEAIVARAYAAAARLRDPAVVPRLLSLIRDSTEQRWALLTLLDYGRVELWRAAVDAFGPAPTRDAALAFFDRVERDTSGLADDPMVGDSVRALARRIFDRRGADLKEAAGGALVRYGIIDDLPSVIGALDRDSASYEPSVLTLVRVTGDGVDAMPDGPGTFATRQEAARWWRAWYASHRGTFRPPSRRAGDQAWIRMFKKIDPRR